MNEIHKYVSNLLPKTLDISLYESVIRISFPDDSFDAAFLIDTRSLISNSNFYEDILIDLNDPHCLSKISKYCTNINYLFNNKLNGCVLKSTSKKGDNSIVVFGYTIDKPLLEMNFSDT